MDVPCICPIKRTLLSPSVRATTRRVGGDRVMRGSALAAGGHGSWSPGGGPACWCTGLEGSFLDGGGRGSVLWPPPRVLPLSLDHSLPPLCPCKSLWVQPRAPSLLIPLPQKYFLSPQPMPLPSLCLASGTFHAMGSCCSVLALCISSRAAALTSSSGHSPAPSLLHSDLAVLGRLSTGSPWTPRPSRG